MRYFPVNLDIQGRKAVIVGGGAVAARKCITLLDAGAAVCVIAPEANDELEALARDGRIELLRRLYIPGDIADAVLVFAATNDSAVNGIIAAEARRQGALVNVTDQPDSGTFTLPAAVTRGDLLLTVSTGGRCPGFSAHVRQELEEIFGAEYGIVTDLMGAVREKLLTEKPAAAYNKSLLSTLASRNLPPLAARGAFAEIDGILLELFGPGYTLAELGVREKDPE